MNSNYSWHELFRTRLLEQRTTPTKLITKKQTVTQSISFSYFWGTHKKTTNLLANSFFFVSFAFRFFFLNLFQWHKFQQRFLIFINDFRTTSNKLVNTKHGTRFHTTNVDNSLNHQWDRFTLLMPYLCELWSPTPSYQNHFFSSLSAYFCSMRELANWKPTLLPVTQSMFMYVVVHLRVRAYFHLTYDDAMSVCIFTVGSALWAHMVCVYVCTCEYHFASSSGKWSFVHTCRVHESVRVLYWMVRLQWLIWKGKSFDK